MKPIKKVMLHEAVIVEIIDYIKQNNLTEGDKLPTERTLSENLQVSRPIVRESLIILEVNHIIIKKHGSGIYINALDSNYLSKFERNNTQVGIIKKLRELGQVRLMIETTCLLEASKIISPAQIEMIYLHEEKENKEFTELSKEESKNLYVNLEFEMLFTKIYNNQFILDFHKTVNELWKKYFDDLEIRPFSMKTRHRDHLAMIKAVESGDEEIIKNIVKTHVNKVIRSCEKLIE